MTLKKSCLVCSKQFFTSKNQVLKGNGKFCSRKCSSISQSRRITALCISCKKYFPAKRSLLRKGYGKYCSSICYFQSDHVKNLGYNTRGRLVGEETREKYRKLFSGKIGPRLGMKHTEETKKILSLAFRGSKSKFWKGGLMSLTEKLYSNYRYSAWRNTIFTRDNFTCVSCGKTNTYLEADHIKPRSVIVNEFLQKNQNLKTTEEKLESLLEYEELWDIKNGRTLCKDCHKLTDTYGGRANNIKWHSLLQTSAQSSNQDVGNCKRFK